jgi:putative ATP-dependent endonuclease of OLD family
MSKNIKLQQIQICKFRSIENVVINFPENKPIILFGPNNVGKSNIFKALNLAWSENFVSESSLGENDYFQRDKNNNIKIMLKFNEDLSDKIKSTLYLRTNFEYIDYKQQKHIEKIGYCSIDENNPTKIYISNEDKEKCQFLMLDAGRDSGKLLGQQAFSILSKLTKHFHKNLETKEQEKITEKFEELKKLYEKTQNITIF